MDFKDLAYVIEISKQKSITKAAKELGISQPALSNFLNSLEKKLGTKLFNKAGRQLVLTYAGETYLKMANSILNIKNNYTDRIHDISCLHDGSISLGITPGRGKDILPNILPIFRDKYPGIKIRIYEENVQLLEKHLLDGTIELALFTVSEEYDQYPDLVFETIAKESIVLCISRNLPVFLAKNIWKPNFPYPWIDLRLLEDDCFILLNDTMRVGQFALRIFKELNMHPENTMILSNIHTAITLADEGFGVAFSSEFSLRQIYKNLDCFSFGNAPVYWNFVAAFRKGSYISEPAKELVAITRMLYSKPSRQHI